MSVETCCFASNPIKSVFRIYRTQYPFIYTLMPDDDERVTSLKAELKNSTGALQPLVITIPTMDCELGKDHVPLRGEKIYELAKTNSTHGVLAVRSAFKRNPKYSYLRWRCACYNGVWIPIELA